MPSADSIRVLFRAAAGPRRGFGHLMRCLSLARALGVRRPAVSLRGGAHAQATARAFGCRLVPGGPAQALRGAWKVLVVDDPVASDSSRWIGAARRLGLPVASVHDLGIGCLGGDVVLDGSVVTSPALDETRGEVLSGARYAILDPAFASVRPRGTERDRPVRVLIALGGGPRVRLASQIAEALTAADPDVRVRIAGGFVAQGQDFHWNDRITWVAPTRGLARELARADVAVVGGGVSLYEACAVGVAAVAVPVVAPQRPTVEGFAARGAAVGVLDTHLTPGAVVKAALSLVRDARLRTRIGRAGRRLVDGRGALRAAGIISALARN